MLERLNSIILAGVISSRVALRFVVRNQKCTRARRFPSPTRAISRRFIGRLSLAAHCVASPYRIKITEAVVHGFCSVLSNYRHQRERRRRRGRLKGSGANKLAALRAASSRTTAPSAIYRAHSALPLPFNCPRAADVHLINAKSLREITISRASERLKRLNSPVALSRRSSHRRTLMYELALDLSLRYEIEKLHEIYKKKSEEFACATQLNCSFQYLRKIYTIIIKTCVHLITFSKNLRSIYI